MFKGDFINRVYKTTGVVLVFAVLIALAMQRYVAAGGIAAGATVGIATLWSLEWVVRRTFVPGATDGGKAFAKYAVLKYPLLAAILVPVVFTRSLEFILAFAAGLTLTHLVVFLKAVGGMINERLNQ